MTSRASPRSRLRAFVRGALASASVALTLAGCSIAPARTEAPGTALAAIADAPFTVEGRLSARRGQDGVTANYRWDHAPPRDAVSLETPLGQGVAELEGDAAAGSVRVRSADGRTMSASDWESLTARALGFPLPVAGLAAWIRGGPHPGSPHAAELDAAGRPDLLRQDGWEIAYTYGDDRSPLPRTLRLTYPGVEVRLVIDRRG